MPLDQVTCPHCLATLKPARPVAEGKSVTCPKCQQPFKAGDEPKHGKSKPAKAKPAKAKPAAVQPAEEEEGGVYAVIKDPEIGEKAKPKKKRGDDDEDDEDEDEEEEEEEDSITQQYLKSLKSTDPRGPAQAAVVSPSNWLLRSGLAGFFGWCIILIVFLIPVVFPIVEKEDTTGYSKLKEKGDEEKKTGGGSSGGTVTPFKILRAIPESPVAVVLFVLVLILGVVHSAFMCVGAVKMVSLESRGWGIASAILAVFPLHLWPLYALLWTLLDFILDEQAVFAASVVFLFGPAVGAYVLSILNREDIKAGYEFKPK